MPTLPMLTFEKVRIRSRYFSEDSFDDDVKLHRMSMKKKKKSRQGLYGFHTYEPVASSHNVILFMRNSSGYFESEEFDSFVGEQTNARRITAKKHRSTAEHTAGCDISNAVDRLRFERIDSEHRDLLAVFGLTVFDASFLSLGNTEERTPDHSSPSLGYGIEVSRWKFTNLSFGWVLEVLAFERG